MIFGINTTSDISKLFYIISRAVRRVKFGTILKYHEWYLCQISRTNHAIICLYYNLRNFCNLTPSVYFRRVVSLRRRANCFRSSCFRPSFVHTLSQVDELFLVFWFSEFSFSSWISWFQNLEIFPPFFRNSCDEIMWWFGVTIVTVIFTCRYFKLSWNTSALSQSYCRNFSGSSIKAKRIRIRINFRVHWKRREG